MSTPDQQGDGSQEFGSANAQPTVPLTSTVTTPPPSSNASKGLALAALIVGIAAFLFGLIPVFGAIVGAVAVVLAILALRNRQSKGMAVTGAILGGIAVITSVVMTLGIGAAVNNATVDRPEVTRPSASPTPEADDAEVPAEEPAPAAPAVPVVSPEFASALIKAESYSGVMHMSKIGVFDQLSSEYGEKFSAEAAQYAVDNVVADWNANALAKAKSYQEGMAMSPEAIRDQLTSAYGEKFTTEEADFAILHLND